MPLRGRVSIVAVVLAVCWLTASGAAHAQTEDLPPAPSVYKPAVPDVGDATLAKTSVDTKWFTVRLGFAPILDYTWLSQDSASISQVGVQADTFEVRSGRVQARGQLFANTTHPWRYLFSFEYKGLDSNPDQTWNVTDVAVTMPVGRVLGELTVGKIKEPFVYEMAGDAANLPQVERLLSPFFASRNVGLRLDRTAFNQRTTWSAGVFNDWFVANVPLEKSGTQVTARMTGLPWIDQTGGRYLHVGMGWRHNGADNGKTRLRGRPESNVTSNYVDTGDIPASHATAVNVESLLNVGPASLNAEYAHARVDSPSTGNPAFSGWYVTGSYVLTGEFRRYDRRVGYARRVLPTRKWGAVELVARVGKVDLDAPMVRGGYLTKWYAGVNWWATRRWRISAGGGRATLDRFGTIGYTNQVFTRVQWIY